MAKKIIQNPAKVLREKSKEITNFNDSKLMELISDMTDTVIKEDGVGLAAPQINFSKRIFVVPEEYAPEIRRLHPKTWVSPKKQTVFINPKIIYYSKKKDEVEEGCLSILGEYHPTNRSWEVILRAKDEKGKSFKVKTEGLLARIFQHEADHLDGILFIDRLHEK